MPHKLGLELLAVSFNRTAPVSVADPGISKLGSEIVLVLLHIYPLNTDFDKCPNILEVVLNCSSCSSCFSFCVKEFVCIRSICS